jgi:hypothetical protein
MLMVATLFAAQMPRKNCRVFGQVKSTAFAGEQKQDARQFC